MKIDDLRSEGSETLEGLSIFAFRVFKSGFEALFIVLLNFFEGLENELLLRPEEML